MTTTHILGDNVPRKSNYDPDLARKITKYYEEHPEELVYKPAVQTSIGGLLGECILMPRANTYALGVNALREQCIKENNQNQPKFNFADGSFLYRPLSFKETIKAHVENYEKTHNSNGRERTLKERLSLITEEINDSCTAIAYKARTTKFKIVPISTHLIVLDSEFSGKFIQAEYDSIKGIEMDSKYGTYTAFMDKFSVQNHEGWLAAVEGDRALLIAYTNIIFAELGRQYHHINGMSFAVLKNTRTDELRQLSVGRIDLDSSACGGASLEDFAHFLRRKP